MAGETGHTHQCSHVKVHTRDAATRTGCLSHIIRGGELLARRIELLHQLLEALVIDPRVPLAVYLELWIPSRQ